MRLAADGMVRLSPSDLANHLACAHLTQLELRVQREELVRPHRENPHAELIRRKGDEHEAAFLAELRARGMEIVEIRVGEAGSDPWGLTPRRTPGERSEGGTPSFEAAASRTEEALRSGAEVVYQGVLASGNWRGVADFLVRVDEPSALGSYSYEAWDTKLARHAKPNAVLQLVFYSHELERIQGRLPAWMHVVLGTGEVETFRPDDFAAFFRRARTRLSEAVVWTQTRGVRPQAYQPDTYPYPVSHCSLCDFLELCKQQWEEDDHLVQVAWIRHDQIERLKAAGIPTLEALGEARPGTAVARMAPQTFETLRHQASLQLHARRLGTHRYDLLPPQEKRGLGLLPAPSPGDLFYDIEGDPFWEPGRSLEYLHGLAWSGEAGSDPWGLTPGATPGVREGSDPWGLTPGATPGVREGSDPWGLTPGATPGACEGSDPWGLTPAFRAIWAHDREAERRAFEEVVDLFRKRRQAFPEMHVYHYAPYETAALKRLAAQHSTREEELDELLRQEVFCDLFTVVRQALRISYESYSIKSVREFFMRAEAELSGGDDAIVLYEQWTADRHPELLERIERYNKEDCVSNLLLRDWLLERKAEAEGSFGVSIPWREPPEARLPDEETAALLGERAELRERLVASGEPALSLAGELLEYHRREAKPVWWSFFARCEMTPEELVEDSESIGSLEPDGAAPDEVARSLVHGFRFPIQQHRLEPGDEVHDPVERAKAGEIVELDDLAGTLRLKRGPSLEETPLPSAIIPGGPWHTKAQREALARLARSLLAGDGRYPHLERVLRREPPLGGARVQRETLEDMRRLVEEVEGSYLFVQGPPGAGKTWTGARLITHLLAHGKRVGVASQSHKAIHKLLSEVETAAVEEGIALTGLKKATSGNEDSFYRSAPKAVGLSEARPQSDEGPIRNVTDADAFVGAGERLFAGTGWLFAREDLDGALDYLFVDEAGQVSLADALALGTAARTLVLLGDPIQLAQVTQGIHPAGSGASVLAHLLGERATVPEEMGLFLERSFRMHPDVCRYISSAFYEDRLESAEGREAQATSFGTGLRFVAVEHEGNSTSSEEEAAAIAAEVERLLEGTWTDVEGVTRPLAGGDFMVVAPFNAQVKVLTERLQEGVAVGTVDKFQGQQAPVVFFSMAASSGEDAPRGIDFLMSRNRLNVAVSRAQCLAYLVCAPCLLDVSAKTVEHMRLANALCRFVELADEQPR